MAVTPVFCDGFEFQLLSASAFGAGGTALYNTVNLAAPDTGVFKNGAASIAISPTGAAAGNLQRTVSGSATYTMSFYWRIATSLPASDLTIVHTNGATNAPSIILQQSSSKLGMRFNDTAVVFGPVIVADTWYLIDWKVDTSGATFTQTARVDGNAGTEATKTRAGTAANFASLRLGTPGTGGPAATMYYDDWVYGIDNTEYPYGTHTVALLKPTSDGTHNAGTNVIEADDGTDIGTATAFDKIDEVPPGNVDYIKQSAAGSGNYAEVVFATPPAGTKWGTTYWCALEGAAANASDLLFRVVDSGGSTLLDQGGAGAVNGTTRRYSVGYLGGDPTGTKGRVGFGTDVTPVPRALTFVAQVAYVPSTGETDFMGMIPL